MHADLSPASPEIADDPAGIPLDLNGHAVRIVVADGRVPHHAAARQGGRVRLEYVDGEIAHFEFGGHRYAVVPAAAPPQPAPARDPLHDRAGSDIRDLLTNRELQIVQLICMGYLTKQVADRLRLSEFTVRSYLKTTYAKLGVRSRGALVFRYARTFAHPLAAESAG